jgi:hypothetical protein
MACRLILVNDDAARERLDGRMVKRDEHVARDSVHIILSRQFLREIGRRGAAARWRGRANGAAR